MSQDETAYSWVLERVREQPRNGHELPLRTMYTLNLMPPKGHCSQRQRHAHSRSAASGSPGSAPSLSSSVSTSPEASPHVLDFPLDHQHRGKSPTMVDELDDDGAALFRQCFFEQLNQMPPQSRSLPPCAINSLVRRSCTPNLYHVDFSQALSVADNLKVLETRRCKELADVLKRLQLDDPSVSIASRPRLAAWLDDVRARDKSIEALYAAAYVGVRRWAIINEMRLEPFCATSCYVMLNILFPPPSLTSVPTPSLTLATLTEHRELYLKYVGLVERQGKSVLQPLEMQGRRGTEANGWPTTWNDVDQYLRNAIQMIEQCSDISGPDYFQPGIQERSSSRPDHAKSDSIGSEKPLPASPGHRSQTSMSSRTTDSLKDDSIARLETTSPPRKKKLDVLTREWRALTHRHEVKEISPPISVASPAQLPPLTRTNVAAACAPDPVSSSSGIVRGLRKMRSTSSLSGRRKNHSPSSSEEAAPVPELSANMRLRYLQMDTGRAPRGLRTPSPGTFAHQRSPQVF